MTIKEYQAFIYSVELGSISKAATKLNSTQSALTHLIINLENELGFKVMKRNKGGVSLTEEGSRIFQTAKDIVDGNDKLQTLASKIRGESSMRINIGAFSSVAVNWLPSIISGFKKLHPEVEFTLTNGNYDDISKALEDGIADIGFITLPSHSNLKCFPLVKDRILALLPKNHHLSTLKSIPVENFSIEPVISLVEKTDYDSRTVFEKSNVKPNIIYRTNDDYAMISMVENNLGICLAPELILNKRTENVCVLETNPPSFRTIAIAIPYEKYANPLTLELADFICNWVKQNCINAI